MSSKASLSVLIVGAMIAASTAAIARKAPPQGSPRLDSLIACRSITDSAARLACYDSNIAPLETAIATKEVVIVDRKKAEETDRSLFGFSSPSLGKMLGFGGELDHIDSTVVSSGFNRDGGVSVTLADGSRWSQTDDKPMFGSIKKGAKVTVKRGMMGSYLVQIDGQVGFKAVRI